MLLTHPNPKPKSRWCDYLSFHDMWQATLFSFYVWSILFFLFRYHQIKAPRWKLAPTRREQDKWDRATKAATGGSVSLSCWWWSLVHWLIRIVKHRQTFLGSWFLSFVLWFVLQEVMFRELRKPRGDPEVLAAEYREQYFKVPPFNSWLLPATMILFEELYSDSLWHLDCFLQLKNKLQLLTVAIGGVGLVSAYISYTPEITLRFVFLLQTTSKPRKNYSVYFIWLHLFDLCWKFCHSFGAGFMGSLAYMRMLGNTVDAMADGARGVMKYVLHSNSVLVSVSKWLTHSLTHSSCLFFIWFPWIDMTEVQLDSHGY